MNTIDIKISKHQNDIIQKHVNAVFRNAALKFYGITTAPVQELVNPELPKIEVAGGAADMVFLLEDDTYLHFAFETGHNVGAVAKCLSYDVRLFERDGRAVHTVIVYTSEVKTKPHELRFETLRYYPDVILMNGYDGNIIFKELKAKIKAGQDLTEIDMLNLALLPLMRHTVPRLELAAKSIELAQTIPDSIKRNACVAAAFAFASKYLSEADMEKIKGVVRMTDLAVMIAEDAIKDNSMEIARDMLKHGEPVTKVILYTKLDESTVQQLLEELE